MTRPAFLTGKGTCKRGGGNGRKRGNPEFLLSTKFTIKRAEEIRGCKESFVDPRGLAKIRRTDKRNSRKKGEGGGDGA